MLKLKIIEGDPDKGKGEYFKEEFSLNYRINSFSPNSIDNRSDCLLMFSFLTIGLNHATQKFIYFDDYTNIDKWNHTNNILLPNFFITGVLKFYEGFEYSEELKDYDDRFCFDFDPIYEYSNGTLKITLSSDEANSEYFLISSDLFVGLKNEMITSLILSNIHFL